MANTKITREDLIHTLEVNGPRTAKEIAYSLRVSYSTVKNKMALMRQEGVCHQRSVNGQHVWFLGMSDGSEIKPVFKKDLTVTRGRRSGTLSDVPPCNNWGGYL